MEFNGRGFYNTLQFSSTPKAEKWQVEDYRALSIPTLFARLAKLKIHINESQLLAYIHEADSPEELGQILEPDENDPQNEKVYLLIFELWRRLNPTKESLSIFCDKIDHLFYSYEESGQFTEELIQALFDLQKIFEDLHSKDLNFEEAYTTVSSYMAQSIESFLFDFIADLIDAHETTLAFEYLFGFYNFIQEKLPFDLLKAALNLLEEPETTQNLFEQVVEHLFEKKQYSLLVEAVYFALKAKCPLLASSITKELLKLPKGPIREEIDEALLSLKEEFQTLNIS